MRKFIGGLLTGRDNRLSGLIAFAILGMIVLGCNCNKEGGFSFGEAEVPSDTEMRLLVQRTLQDFATSVEAGDFTSFRETTSSDFQQQFSPQDLNTAFEVFIQKRMDVVPILRSTATMTPVYSPAPSVGEEKMRNVLSVSGTYSTSPVPTNFKLRYLQDGGQWKIIEIKIVLQ